MSDEARRLGPRRERVSARRSWSVRPRLTEGEYGELAAAATRAGLTVTGFVAEAALADARGERSPSERAAWREALGELIDARVAVTRFGTNVNQAVAELHATSRPPVWLDEAVRMCRSATARLDAAAEELARRVRR